MKLKHRTKACGSFALDWIVMLCWDFLRDLKNQNEVLYVGTYFCIRALVHFFNVFLIKDISHR